MHAYMCVYIMHAHEKMWSSLFTMACGASSIYADQVSIIFYLLYWRYVEQNEHTQEYIQNSTAYMEGLL
jgi:hypothetical protein